MKSAFPYLVMFVLFLAGTRLVNRQQNYLRSMQESAATKPASFTSMLTPDTKRTQDGANVRTSNQP